MSSLLSYGKNPEWKENHEWKKEITSFPSSQLLYSYTHQKIPMYIGSAPKGCVDIEVSGKVAYISSTTNMALTPHGKTISLLEKQKDSYMMGIAYRDPDVENLIDISLALSGGVSNGKNPCIQVVEEISEELGIANPELFFVEYIKGDNDHKDTYIYSNIDTGSNNKPPQKVNSNSRVMYFFFGDLQTLQKSQTTQKKYTDIEKTAGQIPVILRVEDILDFVSLFKKGTLMPTDTWRLRKKYSQTIETCRNRIMKKRNYFQTNGQNNRRNYSYASSNSRSRKYPEKKSDN